MAPEFLCNLLIPGAAKSGTSSLHAALDRHPKISMSLPKEPQFFSFDDAFARGSALHNSFFKKSASARYYGESSQSYFAHPWAIERIRSTLRQPKAIIILRHPVDRLLSQYRWNYKRATETASLEDAIAQRGESVDYLFDSRINMFREVGGYVAFSRYSTWVPLWRTTLGDHNVLLIKFGDFIRNQAGTVRRCFRFLGVEDFHFSETAQENATDRTTIQVVPRQYRLLSQLLPAVVKRSSMYARLRHTMVERLTPDPVTSLDSSLQIHLENALREDIRFFDELG